MLPAHVCEVLEVPAMARELLMRMKLIAITSTAMEAIT